MNVHSLDFSQTYLYKIHTLANALDRLFDQTLRTYAGVSLSQFLVLVTVAQYGAVNQRKIASLLQLSPAAVKRQVDITAGYRLLEIKRVGHESRGTTLGLTLSGVQVVQRGLHALEQHAFGVFAGHDTQATLMEHINLLLSNTKGVAEGQQAHEAIVNVT